MNHETLQINAVFFFLFVKRAKRFDIYLRMNKLIGAIY